VHGVPILAFICIFYENISLNDTKPNIMACGRTDVTLFCGGHMFEDLREKFFVALSPKERLAAMIYEVISMSVGTSVVELKHKFRSRRYINVLVFDETV
jgi:hypothetical protein